LESALPARLDERVLERVVVETRGNPLALLELPRGLTPAQLAGGFGLPAAVPLSASIEESFRRRLARLPHAARRLLLIAAADPVGDPALIWRAAERLGIPETAAQTVESEGFLTLGARVVFRHPLVRSAVYGASGLRDRREIHRALAEATDPEVEPDRRAWHRALSASMPDEEVAAELERSAARAQARGGFAAAAVFLERAASLTPDSPRRGQRALAAAQTKFQAGALDDALGLRETADAEDLDDLERAHADLLRARVAFVSTHGSDAPPLLLGAARRLSQLDPALARETYLEALSAAMFAGRLAAPGGGALDVAQAASAAPAPPVARGPDLLLDGLVMLFSESYEAAVPILRRAQSAFDAAGLPATEQLRWKWLATVSAVHLWDDARWETISERHVQLAREAGALGELPLALSQRVYVHLFVGELPAAASLVHEIEAATEATGSDLAPYGALGLIALRGHDAEAASLIDRSRADVTRRGEGIGLSVPRLGGSGPLQRPGALRAGPCRRSSRDRTSAGPQHLELGHARADRGCRPSRHRMAATATPPFGRAQGAPGRPRPLLGLRDGRVRRAGVDRTRGHRRARPQTDRRQARPAHSAGVADRAAGGGGKHQPRDRGSARHHREHGRVPPAQGVSQARREVAPAARAPLVVGEASVAARDALQGAAARRLERGAARRRGHR
jgi:hypothetical protein